MPVRPTALVFLFVLGVVLAAGCSSKKAAPTAETIAQASFVGDETCVSCHEDLYHSYHRTGMGRSLSQFDAKTAPEQFAGENVIHDARRGYYYQPLLRGDTLYQREFRRNEAGAITHDVMYPAAYVVGSGNATRSYLMERNGYVTEMPLTWYMEKAKWDLSPGYEQTNPRFDRPANMECMTCHTGIPEHSAFTQNHYTEMPLGITCERCHGPASQHVEARLAGIDPAKDGADATIVNPARLDRSRQMAVCEQCHLSGLSVFKEGESPATFRPGDLISAHRTVFAREEQIKDPERFGISSHALRLAQSACFQQSEMTCTTCHDPHVPRAEEGVDAFNAACRSCHGGNASNMTAVAAPDTTVVCSRPGAHGTAEAMTGNCVSCHLQRSGTDDIPHVTFTDHWIRRRIPAPGRRLETPEREFTRTTPMKLVRVTDAQVIQGTNVVSTPEALMDEGIAYYQFYLTQHRLRDYLTLSINLIRTGMAGGANRSEGYISLGRALMEVDSVAAAQRVLETAATRFPNNAYVHYWLGQARLRDQLFASAAEAYRRALQIQPYFSEAYTGLGNSLQGTGDLEGAVTTLELAVQRDPLFNAAAWNNLGFLRLQQQQLAEATRALMQAVRLDPMSAPALVNLGSTYLLTNELPKAQARFEQAIEADPTYAPAYGNLGIVYLNQGQKARARDMFEKVLQLNPQDAQARAMLDQLS